MTLEEIRQKKNQLVLDKTNILSELDAIRQQRRDEVSKLEARFMEKSKTFNDRLNLINKALNLIQQECKYHRLESFYGHCPDCAYYVHTDDMA